MESSMKKKLILKILDELDKNNKLLNEKELNLELEEYGQIVEIMDESNLISGVSVNRCGSEGKYNIQPQYPKITLQGIEYLSKSNKRLKTL